MKNHSIKEYLLLIIVLGFLFYLSQAIPPSATISKVVDGDTIITDKGQVIRLLGIDTPEKGEPNYLEATQELERLVLHRKVYLKCWKKDVFKRDLCFVFFNYKTDIDEIIINKGYSKWINPY